MFKFNNQLVTKADFAPLVEAVWRENNDGFAVFSIVTA